MHAGTPQVTTSSDREVADGLNLSSGVESHMQKITPFLWFNGQAEEAMNFYVSVFKNSKVVSVNRAGPGPKAPVFSVTFQLDGQEFFALNGARSTPSRRRCRSSSTVRRRRKSTSCGRSSPLVVRSSHAGG